MVSDLDAFPAIAIIYKYLSASVITIGAKQDDRYWVSFRMDGKDYAIPCNNPSNPPVPPEGATDIHLVIPPDKQIPFERIPAEIARECYETGYAQAQGKPEKREELLGAVAAKPDPPRKPLWYEEKDEVIS
jgi:hypothetical protein